MDSTLPIRERDGVFSVMLAHSTNQDLAHILDPQIPIVWITCHMPMTRPVWRQTQVQMSEGGVLRNIETRLMRFDIQLKTGEFLKILTEFATHGMTLCQMTQRVSDTLYLDRIPDQSVNRVLVENGLHLRYDLPHAGECACLTSPSRQALERALSHADVRERAY